MDMKRIVEPELMSAQEQAEAYAQADFEAAHSVYPKLFAEKFPRRPRRIRVLDLGCGPCDVTIRFARANPGYRFWAVDGSSAMLRQARRALKANKLTGRIKLVEGFLPGARIPARKCQLILASSFLHHLHDPQILWAAVKRYAARGAMVLVPDLRRPVTKAKARAIVRKYCAGEPEVLRRDFYNSLLAAFTPAEVRRQLRRAGLGNLSVEIVSDRHLLVYGRMQ